MVAGHRGTVLSCVATDYISCTVANTETDRGRRAGTLGRTQMGGAVWPDPPAHPVHKHANATRWTGTWGSAGALDSDGRAVNGEASGTCWIGGLDANHGDIGLA